jgi:hypothetical protein
MYLIVIGWIYVVLMMSVAEATNSNGTLLGAFVTFLLYGAGPVTLVVYLMGAPARSKAIKKHEAEARKLQAAQQRSTGQAEPDRNGADASIQPDAGGHAPGSTETIADTITADPGVAPMRKEP